ncbi:MAG: hypothetical protein M0Z43_13580 [Acidithiobacillus sp.]|nr:hypothetical protein [Acidithiobacillus sp.]
MMTEQAKATYDISPWELNDDEIETAAILYAREAYQRYRDDCMTWQVTVVMTYQQWLEQQPYQRKWENADWEQRYSDLLNPLWAMVYPDDPTGWEYPGQVVNHLRSYIAELKAKGQ